MNPGQIYDCGNCPYDGICREVTKELNSSVAMHVCQAITDSRKVQVLLNEKQT